MTIVQAVNRTTKPLNFMFDGVPGTVRPGYKVVDGAVVPAGRDGQPDIEPLLKTQAEYARRQNVRLGSEDPVSGEAELLIGIAIRLDDGTLVADEHWILNEISHIEQSTKIERLNREAMNDLDASAQPMRTSGFPRGRQGAAIAPFQYADGPIDPGRQ